MRHSRSESISACVACAVALAASACASARAPVREPSTAEPAPASAAPAPAPAAPRPTMADASAACERVQENAEIPVTCRTDYIDDVPSMLVGFRSIDEANAWLGDFARTIGEPFCAAANQSGRPARVYMAIGSGDERRGRRFSCELGKWGDWFSLAERGETTPATLTDAIAACRRVQDDEELPISCNLDDLGGVPAIIVGFPSNEDTERYLSVMAQQVGEPFCDAANLAGRRAAFIITVANAQARPFDCGQQRWGEWFSISAAPDLTRGTIH
jgi:hypothetical protein